MIWRQPFTLLVIAAIVGCGGTYDSMTAQREKQDYGEYESHLYDESPASLAPAEMEAAATEDTAEVRFARTRTAATDDDTIVAISKSATANRKIIYNTIIGLVVDDYRQFESQLPELVNKHGGFVSSSDTDRTYNDRQTGTWVIRIPINSYTAFLSGVSALGFAETRSENAQDVTAEYVDVEARIKNKSKLEERILTMLQERTGKLSDVLEIERELSRVREEIERMEGRLRFLKDRTSLATVTIRCREERAYQPSEAPTLSSRVGRSWSNSLGSVQIAAENIIVALTALVPWMIVLGIPLFVIWKLLKRRWRRRAGTA